MESFLHRLDWVLPLRNAVLTPICEVLTAMGYPIFFVLALSVLYWAWDKRVADRMAILVLFSAIVNSILKDAFADPRPDLIYRMDGHSPDSYGLPSGHTQLAIVFWFWLAWEVRKPWCWITAAVLSAGIAFSRLYLGVHDVEDVLGGAALAVAALFLYRWMIAVRFPFLWLALGLLLGVVVIPGSWMPDEGYALLVYLFAWILGTRMEQAWVGFSKAGTWKTVVVVAAGLLVVIGLREGVEAVLRSAGTPEWADPMVVALVVGLFITWIGPAVFARVHLFNRGEQIPR